MCASMPGTYSDAKCDDGSSVSSVGALPPPPPPLLPLWLLLPLLPWLPPWLTSPSSARRMLVCQAAKPRGTTSAGGCGNSRQSCK